MESYLAGLFDRELLKLRDEINKFKNEENIWRTVDGVSNCTGTLILHLLGNLNFTIGAQLGGTGYVRNRELEFSLTGVPREKLVADIESTTEIVKKSLTGITQAKLDETYAIEFFGKNSTVYYLTYFFGHLNYHLGQINYLRRVLEAE